jgi:hypothetical protein
VFDGLEITAVDHSRVSHFSDASRETIETVAAIIGGGESSRPSITASTWPETNRQLLFLRILAQTQRFCSDARFREWLSESVSVLAASSAALGPAPEGDVRDPLDFPAKESVLPIAHFFLDRVMLVKRTTRRGSRDSKDSEFLVKTWYSLLVDDPLAVPWISRFVRSHHEKITDKWRSELLDIFSRHAEQYSVRDVLAMLVEADRNPTRDAESLLSPYQSRHDQITDAGICSVLLNGKTVEDVTADLEGAIFAAENKVEVGRFAGELAAALPDVFAVRYFERLVAKSVFPGVATIGRSFLFRAPTSVLIEICGRVVQLIGGSITKLQFLMDAMMPNILKLLGAEDAAADLMVAWIDALRLDLSASLRDALLDVIEGTYSMLNLSTASIRIAAAILEKVPEPLQMTVLVRLELNV